MPGKPRTLSVDNAPEFHGDALRRGCEQPVIGVLPYASKDDEVVECALIPDLHLILIIPTGLPSSCLGKLYA